MTTTRTRLDKCGTKDCPFTREEHDEWMERCANATEHGHRHDQPSHQHWPRRSQGGKTIVAVLCWPAHDKIDNGPWGNAVEFGVYRIWDHKGNTLLRVGAPSDGSEGRGVIPALGSPAVVLDSTLLSADSEPSPGASGARAPMEPPSAVAGKANMDAPVMASTPLPLDAWCQKGMTLLYACRRMETMAVVVAFAVGDWVNEGEDSFGEMASQFVDAFSYWRVAKWASVARRVPEGSRLLSHDRITLEHHRAVKECEPGEQRRLLVMAAEQGLSSRALREIVAPSEAQEKPKRWTGEELKERLEEWHALNAYRTKVDVAAFLDWLAQ